MRNAVEKIVKALVDQKDAVQVSEKPKDSAIMVVVQVAESDMGKLIGREGRTIKAIRSLLFAAGQKHGKRYILEIVE